MRSLPSQCIRQPGMAAMVLSLPFKAKAIPRLVICMLVGALASCSGGQVLPTETTVPSPTAVPPTSTVVPSHTPSLTPTRPTPTVTASPTPVPQVVLLRRPCGRDYVVRAGEPVQILYGGWGVYGLDLAQQWTSALMVDITIDESPVEGHPQSPTQRLPLNCRPVDTNLYWIYSMALIPGLSPGAHHVTVTYLALRALPDGSGPVYGPGQIAVQTFRLFVE